MSCQDRYHIGLRQFPRLYPGEMSLKRMLTVYLYPTVLNVKPVYMNQQWSFSICTPSVKQTFGNFIEIIRCRSWLTSITWTWVLHWWFQNKIGEVYWKCLRYMNAFLCVCFVILYLFYFYFFFLCFFVENKNDQFSNFWNNNWITSKALIKVIIPFCFDIKPLKRTNSIHFVDEKIITKKSKLFDLVCVL